MEITEGNIYLQLDSEARAAGRNLTEICKKLGINRPKIQTWKKDEPTALKEIRKIKQEIASPNVDTNS